eukprot:Pompholyxophrys_punicea_v1_NODE_1355_length_769_cov_1.351541.p1 type:complete len:156 gc:universal NODE_1355_length_769_cov_1.351541:527-60(-)
MLFIDEISMMDAKYLEKMNFLAQTCRNNYAIFGGVQVVCVEDFFQLPPPHELSLLFEFPIWGELFRGKMMNLESIFRQTDKNFMEALSSIRTGHITEPQIHFVQQACFNGGWGDETTRLFSLKSSCESLNNESLLKLAGTVVNFRALDSSSDPII